MSALFLVIFAGPLLAFLGNIVGAAVAFLVVLAFHGVRGLMRRVVLPRLQRAFSQG